MPDFSEIFPYLFPPDWPARPYCLCRKVAGADVLVAYGQVEGDRIKFLMAKDAAAEEYTTDDVEAAALPNLYGRTDSPAWNRDEVDWDGALRPLYSRLGNELVSSDLLNPQCLRDVQSQLECDEIKVAIPQSGTIYAVSSDMAWGLAGFAKINYEQALERGAEGLTPYLFTVVDGQITGFDTTDWDEGSRPY